MSDTEDYPTGGAEGTSDDDNLAITEPPVASPGAQQRTPSFHVVVKGSDNFKVGNSKSVTHNYTYQNPVFHQHYHVNADQVPVTGNDPLQIEHEEVIPTNRRKETVFSLSDDTDASRPGIDESAAGISGTEPLCSNSSSSEQRLTDSSWFGQFGEENMAQWLVKKNRVTLVKTILFHQIKDHLIQYEVLEKEEVKTIRSEETNTQRMSSLLDIVSEKSKDSIQTFFKAVEEANPEAYGQCVWPHPPKPLPDSSFTPHLCKIKEELESWYDRTLSKLRPIPWIPFYEMEMDHVYTNLEIISGYKHRLCERGCDTVIGDVEQLADMLWGGDAVTLIEGAPGIGKSTLCRRLAYTWATNSGKIHKIPFKLVIFLEARAMQTNFKRCIYQQLFPEGFDLNEDDVYKCVRESQKDCLVIIDGIDELNEQSKSEILDLLQGRILRKSHVLLTGRPEVSPNYLQFCDNHLRITGFIEENRDSYIHKYFADQCVPRDKLLLQISKNRYLRDLTVNPFITLLLCVLAKEGCGDIPLNLHGILKEITRMVCRRYVSSDAHKERTPPSVDGLLSAYRYLAFIGIRSDKLVFEESFIRQNYPGDMCEHLLKSGLFNRDYTVSRIHSAGYCYFPHKTIQELLCCEYLADLTGEEFVGRWNIATSSLDMLATLLNVLGNQPDKFDLVLTDFTAKRTNRRFMEIVTLALTNVQSQNSFVDYIIKSHGHNVNKFLDAWSVAIDHENSYILQGFCDKGRLPPILLIHGLHKTLREMEYHEVLDPPTVNPENHWLKVSTDCFENISVKLPIVICEDIFDAIDLLEFSVDTCIGFLAVIQPLTDLDFQDVCVFIDMLKRKDRSMTVYLCLLSFSENDYQNDYTKLKLLRLIDATKCQKTRLHVDVKNLMGVESYVKFLSEDDLSEYKKILRHFDSTIFLKTRLHVDVKNLMGVESYVDSQKSWITRIPLIKPIFHPHRMYYEKYCPY